MAEIVPPTRAHHAVAKLVAGGWVKVVLTTNFDRPPERAVADAGVSMTVLASPDAVTGALPLVHAGPTLVKLLGDQFDPRIPTPRWSSPCSSASSPPLPTGAGLKTSGGGPTTPIGCTGSSARSSSSTSDSGVTTTWTRGRRWQWLVYTLAQDHRSQGGRYAGHFLPHVRLDGFHPMEPVPKSNLSEELDTARADHPLLHLGLFGGDPDRMEAALDVAGRHYAEQAEDWAMLASGQAGMLPSGRHYGGRFDDDPDLPGRPVHSATRDEPSANVSASTPGSA